MDGIKDLDGLSALVTGATSGMGRVFAEELARRGATVTVHGRDAGRGQAVVDAITAAGGQALFAAADLGDPAGPEQLAAAVGTVDVLVNNAGFSWFGPTAELTTDQFDALFASDVRAPYFLVAALAPQMAERGRGSIINVSSMAARIGLASGAVYGATKAALESLTGRGRLSSARAGCASTRSPLAPSIRAGRPASGPRRWARRRFSAGPHSQGKSPGWWLSLRPLRRAT